MKKLIFVLLLLSACSKKDDSNSTTNCKTCTVNVTKVTYGASTDHYIESSTVYCNGEWANYDGKVEVKELTTATTHIKYTKKTTCQ